ncbi:c-type cytochrome domain-containing protein [Mucilaginibacter sabulilitoris]|uniref:C-type cytochrome domain-containing protein n=1 Tax=Mucilaginibacter sabulilitoris TaxID=1173583 RepID=A0ABZ0TIP0_9SPHI|nr:c-type cytochrome domain-containing protein [Mucilaginibacter sabulilitoris]WPU92272.1 c-type cytochrome domain-containing protein [Mucilaginibacter sabulilitoris]
MPVECLPHGPGKVNACMILGNITEFSGHLHPLIVHLPIGFILLAAVFNILSYFKKYENLKPAVSVTLLIGFISAILACIFGYILSLSGDYDPATLTQHKFSGIMLAAISGLLYFISTDKVQKEVRIPGKLFSVLLVGLIGLMSYSGHQGASLTHGSDYLTMRTLMQEVRDKPASIESAMIYEDVVAPILQRKCAQCHQGGKQKGNLSVESLQTLLKGGKNGPAVVAGKLSESELYKRITLDPEHKDFMPADGKPPLTKTEVLIIKWWIAQANAVQGKTIAQLKNSDSIKSKIGAYLGFNNDAGGEEGEKGFIQAINPDIPLQADTMLVNRLRTKGLMVRMMLKKPIMLDVTLPANSGIKMADIQADLMPLAKNIIWLNLSGNNFTDKDLAILRSFTNLEKLRIEKNPVTDGVSADLLSLKHLQAVNLNETKITGQTVANLKKNPGIKRIYTWGTAVKQAN